MDLSKLGHGTANVLAAQRPNLILFFPEKRSHIAIIPFFSTDTQLTICEALAANNAEISGSILLSYGVICVLLSTFLKERHKDSVSAWILHRQYTCQDTVQVILVSRAVETTNIHSRTELDSLLQVKQDK